jgi:hypothetical protein
MTNPAIHKITIAAAYDHRGERLAARFNVKLGDTVLIRGATTPFYSAARELLERGLAMAADAIEMRHRGSQHVILRGTVGKAARMAETAPQAGRGAPKQAGSYLGGEHDEG